MFRRLAIVVVPAMACVGLAPAQAAPVAVNYAVHGTVAGKCAMGTPSPNPMVLTGTVASNSTLTVGTTQSWTVSAVCNSSSTLSVSAQSLRLVPAQTSVASKASQTVNYTISASGWTTTPATVTTADTTGLGTTTSWPGTGQTRSGVESATITVSAGNTFNTVQNGTPTKLVPGSYQSTITLTLSAN